VSQSPRPIAGSEPALPTMDFRPSWWSVVPFGQPWWIVGLVLLVAHTVSLLFLQIPLVLTGLIGGGVCLLALVQGVVRRSARRYTLSPDTARVRAGVFTRIDSSFPMRSITQTTLTAGPLQRMVGAGSIALGGNDGPLLQFLFVPRAARVLRSLRAAVERSKMSVMEAKARIPIPVIGLSGGIGSGKSTVARAFAAENCLVIDADADARAALMLPHVRDQIVQWWGPAVLSSEGSIDRSKVASIVFSNPVERKRLEELVHPIVKADRRKVVARAGAEGRIGAVIDAPLLFEVGSDAECDTLVFVDAPRSVRLARVAESRGWTEAELDRREAVQLPIEEKRRRSNHVIVNDGSPKDLVPFVRAVLASAGAPRAVDAN